MNAPAYSIACDLPHDDPEWLQVRRSGIGASEMPVLLGASTWGSPLSLWGQKTGRIQLESFELTEPIRWGRKLEPLVIQEFEERTGLQVITERRTLRSGEIQWALASLDAWAMAEGGLVQVPLETKAIGVHVAHEWEEGAPEKYRIQLHQQMLVTGSEIGFIAALIGGQKFVWERVERDPILIRKIIHAGNAFWDLVTSDTQPEADGSDSTKRALEAIYGRDDGSTLLLDGIDWIDVFDELEAISADQKALVARKELLENRLKAAIGAASQVVLLNGARVSWKSQKRAAHMVAESEFRVLRRTAPKKDRKVA